MKDLLKKLSGFLIVIVLLVLLAFVKSEQDKCLVKEVPIKVDTRIGDPFMDRHDVENLVYKRLDTIEGKAIGNVQLNEVENLLELEPSVKNAEVYKGMEGDVHIDVELKRVVARLKPDTTNGFYIDETGGLMSWVAKYTPRVLTVTGNLSKYNRFVKDSLIDENLMEHSKLIADVYALAQIVEKDSYWKAQIGQVYIEDNGDAVIIPLAGDQEFILGDLSDCEEKLNKMKIFHQEIAQKVGWEKYKVVNLKFENQIVCK